jgi:hypothetical protein
MCVCVPTTAAFLIFTDEASPSSSLHARARMHGTMGSRSGNGALGTGRDRSNTQHLRENARNKVTSTHETMGLVSALVAGFMVTALVEVEICGQGGVSTMGSTCSGTEDAFIFFASLVIGLSTFVLVEAALEYGFVMRELHFGHDHAWKLIEALKTFRKVAEWFFVMNLLCFLLATALLLHVRFSVTQSVGATLGIIVISVSLLVVMCTVLSMQYVKFMHVERMGGSDRKDDEDLFVDSIIHRPPLGLEDGTGDGGVIGDAQPTTERASSMVGGGRRSTLQSMESSDAPLADSGSIRPRCDSRLGLGVSSRKVAGATLFRAFNRAASKSSVGGSNDGQKLWQRVRDGNRAAMAFRDLTSVRSDAGGPAAAGGRLTAMSGGSMASQRSQVRFCDESALQVASSWRISERASEATAAAEGSEV